MIINIIIRIIMTLVILAGGFVCVGILGNADVNESVLFILEILTALTFIFGAVMFNIYCGREDRDANKSKNVKDNDKRL